MNWMKAAQGIEYWLKFYQVVGKRDLIIEDTIKYPLIDYLIADGNDIIKNIKLEESHPIFPSKEVDLISKDNKGLLNYCIEFKLTSPSSLSVMERQRFVNDILRLHYIYQKYSCPCFFIVAGKSKDFLTEFHSIYNRTPGRRGRPSKKDSTSMSKISLAKPAGFYSDKLLSFNNMAPGTIIDIINESDETYISHYEKFKLEYNEDYSGNLNLPNYIYTNLEYITKIEENDTIGEIPAMVGIWKVL